MINLFTDNSTIIVTTTPRIEFNNQVPSWFITEFVKRMAKNQIKITDYQGNELRVYYESFK